MFPFSKNGARAALNALRGDSRHCDKPTEPVGTTEAEQIVSEHWGTARRGPWKSWFEHPVIQKYVHRRVSGDPNISTVQWFKNKFFQEPVELCMSLGCGFGIFERHAISLGMARRVHACDLSTGAIGGARQEAANAGMSDRIHYDVVDLNKIKLPPASYDAIFALSSTHHVSNLENLFDQCRTALKPGALMFMDEYIGPNRFQTFPEVSELINKILASLPANYSV